MAVSNKINSPALWAMALLSLFCFGALARADEQCTFVMSSAPDVLFILDSSGSMTFDCTRNNQPFSGGDNYGDPTGGDGSNQYPGRDANGDGLANDSRLYMLKTALRVCINNINFANLGLMRFYQHGRNFNAGDRMPNSASAWYGLCPLVVAHDPPEMVIDTIRWGHVRRNYAGWDRCSWMPDYSSLWGTYNPGRFDAYTATYDTHYVSVDTMQTQARLYWNGSGNCGADADMIVAPETPITRGRDSMLMWVDNEETMPYPGYESDFNPEIRGEGATPMARGIRTAARYYRQRIQNDNLKNCRNRFVIILTDGLETCGGDPLAEVDDLRDLVYAGQHYDIQTYVLAVGINNPVLDQMAYHGGTERAYQTNSTDEILNALNQIFMDIRVKSFSFSSPGLSQFRGLQSGYLDKLYLASFIPGTNPIWEGHLKTYDFTGGRMGNLLWDAGDLIRANNASGRTLYTYKSGSRIPLNWATAGDLEVTSDSLKDEVFQAVYGPDVGRMGDIFHSSPLVVGSGNPFYEDQGYSVFRDSVSRVRRQVVYAGSNDGLLHCFDDSTGRERWGFVPPQHLSNLQLLLQSHQYFVDGPCDGSDIWLPSNADDSIKTWDEWRTMITFGDMSGGNYITGLDVTDPDDPTMLFNITDQARMGYTWSEPRTYQIKSNYAGNNVHRFMTFFGGGYWPDSLYSWSNPLATGVRGNMIYAYDIYGRTLYPFTSDSMKYPLAGTPTLIAHDPSAYAGAAGSTPMLFDRLYIGDVGGQLWKVYLDSSNMNWVVQRFFVADTNGATNGICADQSKPFYFAPRLWWDYKDNQWWIFIGTGDRSNPCKLNSSDRFYAIKDGDYGAKVLTESDLKRVSPTGSYSPSDPEYGWYVKYRDFDSSSTSQRAGEKTFGSPTILHFPDANVDSLYFNTYQPEEAGTCSTGSGKGRLYRFETRSGGHNQAGEYIGAGVPTSPQVSVGMDGNAVMLIGISESGLPVIKPLPNFIPKKLLHWREIK